MHAKNLIVITFLIKKYDLLSYYAVRYRAFRTGLENTGK